MKEQDLHIGCNYRLTEKMGGGILTIKTRKDLLDAFELFDKGCVEAILLTPDVMERIADAEKDTDTDYRWFLLNRMVAFDVDDGGLCISDCWLDRKLKHLHELQSLYNFLTGEFLPYKQ